MAKKKTLSLTDKFYLDNHIKNNPTELAEAVGVDVSIIDEYLRQRQITLSQDVDRLFAKKQRNGHVVATVSTEAASTAADENRTRSNSKQNPNIIYRPKG